MWSLTILTVFLCEPFHHIIMRSKFCGCKPLSSQIAKCHQKILLYFFKIFFRIKFLSIYKIFKLCKCVWVLDLSLTSNVVCGKNTFLSLKEGILSGEEFGDEVGVLFLCGVDGDGGGELDTQVSLCVAVAIACAIEIDWGLVVDCCLCWYRFISLRSFQCICGYWFRVCFCLRLCISCKVSVP